MREMRVMAREGLTPVDLPDRVEVARVRGAEEGQVYTEYQFLHLPCRVLLGEAAALHEEEAHRFAAHDEIVLVGEVRSRCPSCRLKMP